MTRQIKFRIWCKKENKMYPPIVLQEYMSMSEYAQDDIQPAGEENRLLLEWTGLHDKNGKEIFEGDIVEVEREGETWGDFPTLVRHEVKFAEGAFYTHREFTVNENKLPTLAYWGEVIGNIYENPDLTK